MSDVKLNVENAKKWVKELRSGRYKQGFFSMKHSRGDSDLHCCLGVAHECLIGGELGEGVEYYQAIEAKLGITEMQRNQFICMNDGEALTFEEIADRVEKLIEEAK